jgi:uncharacterized membrane protein YgcG
MRKFLVGLAACALLLIPSGVKADAQDFNFASFEADYYLTRDQSNVAEMRAVETLKAEFPADRDQNHGIVRGIPEDYQGHPLELRIQKVTYADGKPIQYETSHDSGHLVLKIGDPNAYVRGDQTYIIEYTMRGVSLPLDDHEEFFWDINGDQWRQSFGKVEARVHLPPAFAGALDTKAGCYVGAPGGRDSQKCVIAHTKKDDGGALVTIATATGVAVQPGQTMSVVLGFRKGTFANYSPSAWQVQQWAIMIATIAALPLLTLLFVVRKWWIKGRDPSSKNAVVSQYLPPKELSVLSSGLVLTETFVPKSVSATIIDLAVRHYIKIYETKQKGLFKSAAYELELVKEPADLRAEEQEVVKMVFAGAQPGTRIKLDDLKTELSEKAKQLGKAVEVQLTNSGYFTRMPSKARLPYYIAGVSFVAVGFFFIASGLFVALGLIFSGVILLIGANVMPSRTTQGVAMRNYLLGVRDYMKLAEADRIKVLQSPHGDLTEKVAVDDQRQLVKLYEKLLPYAMLFGIEQDWAKEMAGLYETAPDWYTGNAAFNAAWFASSFSAFSASAATTFTPPSDSSSSGFGGGAGGGGGGGGGGGW